MLLTVKKRQTYLKKLGFYDGKVDGKIGPKTIAAYKELQVKYFTRKSDKDGKYGPNTDTLLRNAYNIYTYAKNFDLKDFKCGCGGKHCTGYPVVLNTQLLKNVQAIDDEFGGIRITSGMRCVKHNASLVGSSSTSRHKSGKAVDFKNDTSKSVAGRRKIMTFCKKLKGYRYTYCNVNGSHPNMGTAVHFDVK